MKILVTGGSGMLGSALIPVLRSCEHTVLTTDINILDRETRMLDVRNLGQMMEYMSDFKPSMLIHLAAETDLEVCESDSDYAYLENFIGTQNACVACNELSIPLVYVSTAGVFDGTKEEPYTEFDAPNPINVYGASKLRGEEIVRETHFQHYIIRAGWMIGGGRRDKKFVSKIMNQIKDDVKEICAVTDKKGTPTYTHSFCEILERIMRTGCYGTYHLACKGSASRYDVAAEILRLCGRNDIRLTPVSSDYFSREYYAPRPFSEELRNYVLDLRSMNDMPHWRDALERYFRSDFPEMLGT